MTQTLSKNIIADFETQLAVKMAVGATTGTLVSATDDDGVALPTGTYFLTLDKGNSKKEYIKCTLTGTALTSVYSISRQGALTSGTAREHRVGANVIISDFAGLSKINDLLTGVTSFDSGTPLKYDGQPTLSDATAIPTVQYVLDTVNGGTVSFSSQTFTGIAGEDLVEGDIVYFKESDQKWWKSDADVTATFDQVQLAVNQAIALTDAGCTVLVSGIADNFSGLTAGTKYYLSNTAGGVTSSSLQTTTVFIGVATNTTSIKFFPQTIYWPTKLEKDAITGLASFTGTIVPSGRRSAPSGFLMCDGTAVSRATYADLFNAISPSMTFTVTIATPGVFTSNSHGLVIGDKLHFTTTGALPTGLAINTDYYVISAGLTANAFQVSTSRGGSAVNTTGSQSGTHTLYVSNYGKGDGSTTFNVPDLRGYIAYGYSSSDANFNVLNVPNTYAGEKTHVLTQAELPAIAPTITATYVTGGGGLNALTIGSGSSTATTTSYTSSSNLGSGAAHNNLPPYVVVNYLIKT